MGKAASGLIDLCYAIHAFLFIDRVLEFVNLYLHIMSSKRELSERVNKLRQATWD